MKQEAEKERLIEQQRKTISYYDENAEDFFASTKDADMSETRNHFLQHLQSGAKILDAGCGSGRDSKYFLEHGYQVTAMDASESMCRLAGQYLGQSVQCRWFEEITEKNTYDGIWACASLLHVPYASLPKVIARLEDALTDGGVLYASFKYGGEEILPQRKERESKGRYFTDLTENGFREILSEAEKYRGEFRYQIDVLECFITGDVREGREHEKWLNVVGKKRILLRGEEHA